MGKGLTGIGSGAAASLENQARPLTLLEPPAARSSKHRAGLLAAIHHQVIPALLGARRVTRSAAPPAPESMVFPSARAIGELARIAAREDLERALAFVDGISAKGLPQDRILFDLIVPAASLLDVQESSDVRTGLEVALGKSLLQMLVHVLGARCAPVRAHRGLVLLVASPCERAFESVHVEAVCISVGVSDEAEPLRSLVSDIRRASRNRDIAVLLAGSLVSESAASVGADCCATDARDAARWLDGHANALPASRLM
jgi:hypothetical protein